MSSQKKVLLLAVAVLATVTVLIYFPWPDRSGRVEVTGIVRLDGQPLDVINGSSVVFQAAELGKGQERTVSGPIDRQGRYRVDAHRSARGVHPGRYRVSIKAWQHVPGFDADNPHAPLPPSAVPKRYEDADASGLAVEVTKAARQVIDLELTK